MISPNTAILAGLGPLTRPLGDGTGTALTASGIYNSAALGTTATKVYTGGRNGRIVKAKIVGITASRNIAWTIVNGGAAAPVIKADADGSSDEGSLIMGGSGVTEWVTFPDSMDLYIVASAASTAVQVTIAEVA